MAELIIHRKKIQENIIGLGEFFEEKGIKWSLITKVFSGNKKFLRKILTPEIIQHINSVGDSRLSSLDNLRQVNPKMHTIYIKPPAAIYAREVIELATVSLNSSLETIFALNEEAGKENIQHEIIVMIEMGELREGVNEDDTLDFFEKIYQLPNIKIAGIGSNLGCMYGIVPDVEKFETIIDLKRKIEKKFQVDVPLISAGTSITLPMLEKGDLPKEINHFRVGEAAFFGVSPLTNKAFGNLHTETFQFKANIIELEEKKLVPEGEISDANIGRVADYDEKEKNKSSHKAILDFGLVDVDQENLSLYDDRDINFVGITSDMTVIDIGSNENPDGSSRFKVGDTILFRANYMAVVRLLNSKFVAKVYVDD
ncbi:MAG: amino-acid racemase [Flavobacteriales bacterium]|nr:amino-acid racemase [Flavobacteriales bacterium]